MAAISQREHWQQIYASKREAELSWFELAAGTSLELLLAFPLRTDAAIIDVGAGTSRLVDSLLDRGFTNITALDLAGAALEKSQLRLASRAFHVRWIEADITEWKPDRAYSAWHDRAVFHFLVSEEQRRAYRAVMENAVAPGGIVVIGTFALDGPQRCSGLPVVRYSPETLAAELGSAFHWTDARNVEHVTPAAQLQHFQFSRFVKE